MTQIKTSQVPPHSIKAFTVVALSLAIAACSSSETGTLLGSNNNTNSTINVTVTGSGTVISNPEAIDCPGNCSSGFQNQNQVTLTAAPESGWVLSHWQGACTSNADTCVIDTNNNSSINVQAVFNQLSNNISVDDFSLINADTDQAINGFDPIANNAQINLNQLNGIALNLRANTTGAVQSVKFGLGEQANYRTENSAPYALNNEVDGNYQDWGLGLGQHQVSAAAFDQANAQGSSSSLINLNFSIVAVKWQSLTSELNFNGALNAQPPAAQSIQIRNSGNISGNLSLQSSLPSWLTLSDNSLSVGAEQTATISASTATCQALGNQSTNLVFGGDNATNVTIPVQRSCSEVPDNDFALNRFYINQSVPAEDSSQTKNQRTPLVANRGGLARAFVTATNADNQSPQVVMFYRYSNGFESSVVLSGPNSVPLSSSESNLNTTFNSDLASNLIQPGMEIYIEVDPNNEILEANESNNRYPTEGYLSVDVDQVPSLNIVVVPIRVNNGPTPSYSQSQLDTLFRATQKLHPVAQINISQRAPISYNGSSWEDMLEHLQSVYQADSNTNGKLYHGIVDQNPDNSNTAGIGYLGYPVAISRPFQGTIAHEVGHNFDLPHAPCGGPSDADVNYPYANADIGIYGYDIIDRIIRLPNRKDVMSYCDPIWISDYNYKKVLAFRQSNSGYDQSSNNDNAFAFADSSIAQASLLVSGVIESETARFTQVMQLEAHAKTTAAGPYRLAAYGTDGDSLFELPFDSLKLDHSSRQHFSLTIPLAALDGEKIARLAVYLGDKLLAEQGDTPVVSSEVIAKQQNLGLSWQSGELVLSWNQQSYQSVLVKNAQGETIGLDKSGVMNFSPTQLGVDDIAAFDDLDAEQKRVKVIYSRGISSHSENLIIPAP